MNFKLKHIDKLKNFALGALLATTAMSCENKQNQHFEYVDMLSLDSIKDKDMFDKSVVLEKVEIPVYKTKKMKDEHYFQLRWGTKNQPDWPDRSGEKTHAEEVVLEDSSRVFVEVYKDGVLKSQNCFAVVDGKISLIGDKKTYMLNLLEYKSQRMEAREKAERLKKIQDAEERQKRLNLLHKIEAEKDSLTQKIKEDSMKV